MPELLIQMPTASSRTNARRVRRIASRIATHSAWTASVMLATHSLPAQQRVTRVEAVAAVLGQSPRIRLARADSSAARAALAIARQFENPTFGASYSKSQPQAHFTLDLPFDLIRTRQLRISAATSALDAASSRFAFAREALAFTTDTTYTIALAATARARLSQRSARAADSLLVLTQLRRDAGDASELDVEIARLFAGQAANASAADSLAALTAVVGVQVAMGLSGETPSIILSDSLVLDPLPVTPAFTGPRGLLLSASEHDLRTADLLLEFEKRRRFGSPAISLGVETINPGGPSGALPTIGFSLPLPLFNRNTAATDVARVGAERARAQLALDQIELRATLAQARREALTARARAERSAGLVSGADRVAALSLLAYREGASTLVTVLESQRTARETLSQYLIDLAVAHNAAALVRLLTLSVSPSI